MNDELFKKLVINYLHAIHLSLKHMNEQEKVSNYEDDIKACERVIFRLIKKWNGCDDQ